MGHQQSKKAEPVTPKSVKTLKETKINLDAISRSKRKLSLEEKLPNLGLRTKIKPFPAKSRLFPF